MSDPGVTYRTREEVAEVRKMKDPITMLERRMIDCNLSTEKELEVY